MVRYLLDALQGGSMTEVLALTVAPEVLEAIAERAAELVVARQAAASPWMERPEAADYMGVSTSWLEKRRDVPSYTPPDSTRVLYNRHALDAWLEQHPNVT